MALNQFPVCIVGAEYPMGHYLLTSLSNESLLVKGMRMDSSEKLPAMSGGRPFVILIPSEDTANIDAHIEYWLTHAQQLDAHVLLLSSLAIYGEYSEAPYDEAQPASEPSRIWQHIEELVAAYPNHIILRTGALLSFQQNDVGSQLLSALRQQSSLQVDDRQRFNPTPINDLADVILAVMRQVNCNDELYGVYNVAGVEACTAYEFAETLVAEAGQYEDFAEMTLEPVAGGWQPDMVAPMSDNTKLFHAFGIRPKAWRPSLSRLLKSYYQS